MNVSWTIALFAGVAERLGVRLLRLDWEEAGLSAGEVKRRLIALYPEHTDLLSICFMAKNQAFASDETIVSANDELALLPPVSGGAAGDVAGEQSEAAGQLYRITEAGLDVREALELVSHPDHGASLAFVGTTREWTRGARTKTLEYEAYAPMALAALADIGSDVAARWPGTLCAIFHRIGVVGINEISVVIAVSSPHRAEAYEASRYAIERLKVTVPIWKKEVYEDGSEWKGYQTGTWNPLAPHDEPR